MRLSEPVRDQHAPSIGPAEAKRMFHRMLANWAGDVLHLRKHGLDRPGLRSGHGHPFCGVADGPSREGRGRRRAA